MRNAAAIRAIPIIAYVMVCCADAVAFGSPLEVRNLNPPIINMIKRAKPARLRAIVRMLLKTTSRHLMVGIPSTIHPVDGSSQFFIEERR